jgi:UDP-N-acetylglucosamine 2-epimerase
VRIVSVVGTRPQLIKAAALLPAIRARHDEVFVDTGQHWDESMAGAFFSELELPRPDYSLGIGGGSPADQTGRMLSALDAVLAETRPDAVIVYGDTNSTLAGALASAQRGVPVGHVEAGLRSFDRRMPEETNRIVADHLSRWLFAPTPAAVDNLRAEGLGEGIVEVGDVLQDLAARTVEAVTEPAILAGIEATLRSGTPGLRLRSGGYLFATIHRASNRDPVALRAWAELLGEVARPERPVVLPLHPGTGAALVASGISLARDVHVVQPVGYRTAIALQLHAAAVLTDSGGVQREASWLGVPCLVLRETTEWVEAVRDSGGLTVVVGLDGERARSELARLAPPDLAERIAVDRAASVEVEPAGAIDAIVAALERDPVPVGATGSRP